MTSSNWEHKDGWWQKEDQLARFFILETEPSWYVADLLWMEGERQRQKSIRGYAEDALVQTRLAFVDNMIAGEKLVDEPGMSTKA